MISIFIGDSSLILAAEQPAGHFPKYQYNEIFSNEKGLELFIKEVKNQRKEVTYLWGAASDVLFDKLSAGLVNITAAGGLVQNPLKEILFIKRKGKWDLPKGKPEENETLTQTAIREVEEECDISGLSIIGSLPSTYHIYEDEKSGLILKKSVWYHMVSSDWENPVVQEEEEITEARWIKMPVPENIIQGAFLSIRQLVNFFENNYNPVI